MRLIRPICLTCLVPLFLGACSMASLDKLGHRVTVIEKPYAGCEYVTTVYSRSNFEESALNNMRNRVGLRGGTHVVITAKTQFGRSLVTLPGTSQTLHGIGYRCPAQPR